METSQQPNLPSAPTNRANTCNICHPASPNVASLKNAPWCRGCPREFDVGPNISDVCHFVDARGTKHADVILIAEAPVNPRMATTDKLHEPFCDDAGKVITTLLNALKAEDAFRGVKVHTTYAVLCSGLDPDKATIDHCRTFLTQTIKACTADPAKPPVIIAMGAGVLKALSIKVRSLKEVQSRVLAGIDILGTAYTVIPTISTKMLVSAPGLYPTFNTDVRRAFELSSQGIPEAIPLEELTKDYVIPMTVEAVRDVCTQIVEYSEDGRDPAGWAISVDTETNTLFPHRPDAKIIAVSFAWATGRATCIPLWHPECPYDPELVVPYVQQVLSSRKPKVFHNLKYDQKMFFSKQWLVENIVWDTMLGEHVLEEDKKGQYGLKQITRTRFPLFANYADELQELLRKQEGDSQLDNVRKKKELQAADSLIPAEAKPKKKKAKTGGGFERLPLAQLLLYGAVDADMTRRIGNGQLERMDAEEARISRAKAAHDAENKRCSQRGIPVEHLTPRFCTHPRPSRSIMLGQSVPVSKVLARMEYDGVRVDRPYLTDLYGKLGTVVENAAKELQVLAGKEIKLNHAAAIANLLFSEGFIHPDTGKRTYYTPDKEWKTKTGQWQTTEKVLQVLLKRHNCPFSAKKLNYSKAYKARNTFCANVLDLSEMDGRLHTNYNIHGTATARLSSNDENMQNIPKKLAGHKIKSIFIPSDDSMVFVNADAKSAEIKIFAAYSRDPELIQALNDGLDTHSFFAAKIVEQVRLEGGADEILPTMALDNAYPLTYDDFAARDAWKEKDAKYGEMLDRFRTAVKRVVFGILYGAGPAKIAETIGISRTQAQAIIDMLFRMFPSIPKYISDTKWELGKFGHVETYFGRRRRFDMKGATGMLRSRAERQAVNFKIQSTSSDIVLGRLVDVAAPLERDLGGRLLITVHDSIAFELPKKHLSQLPSFVDEYLVKRASEKHPWLPVAFSWDFEVGPSYGELKSYDAYIKGVQQQETTNEIQEAYTDEEVEHDLASVDQT